MEGPYASVSSNPRAKELRIVWTDPGETDDIVRCYLDTHCLDLCPSFTASSYIWGIAVEANGIENGPFWVDAICINRSLVHERNHQVQLMGQIYFNATHASGLATMIAYPCQPCRERRELDCLSFSLMYLKRNGNIGNLAEYLREEGMIDRQGVS